MCPESGRISRKVWRESRNGFFETTSRLSASPRKGGPHHSGSILQTFSGFWAQKARVRSQKGLTKPKSRTNSSKTISGRIKHAPNCGYRFVSPLPPFSRRGFCRFPVPENAVFLWEVILFLQNLLYESAVFTHREFGGKR